MSKDAFELTKVSDAGVEVTHTSEGHRYSFPFAVNSQGRRVLGTPTQRPNDAAKHSGAFFEADARQFAEREAQARKKID